MDIRQSVGSQMLLRRIFLPPKKSVESLSDLNFLSYREENCKSLRNLPAIGINLGCFRK